MFEEVCVDGLIIVPLFAGRGFASVLSTTRPTFSSHNTADGMHLRRGVARMAAAHRPARPLENGRYV